MISRYTVDVTSQRMRETEEAIIEQRRYVESLTDPALKVIATRTLTTLEDIVLIMRRTRALLIATASDAADDAATCDELSVQHLESPTSVCSRS